MDNILKKTFDEIVLVDVSVINRNRRLEERIYNQTMEKQEMLQRWDKNCIRDYCAEIMYHSEREGFLIGVEFMLSILQETGIH